MTAGPNDLCTVSEVQAYQGLPSGQDVDILQSLVTSASAFIQSLLGFNIALASYSETRNGNGRSVLVLKNKPVVSVQSLSIGGVAQSASPGYGQTGYGFDSDCLYLVSGRFPRAEQNVSISYTAGYQNVPADLAQACVELAAFRYQQRLKAGSGYVSESAMQQTTSYSQRDMPMSVATAIASYRRVF